MGMLALGACRGDDTSGDDGVDVDGVWSPATPAAAGVGAVYLRRPSADAAQEPVAGPILRIHSMSDSISASSSPLTGIATS